MQNSIFKNKHEIKAKEKRSAARRKGKETTLESKSTIDAAREVRTKEEKKEKDKRRRIIVTWSKYSSAMRLVHST